MQKKKKSSAQLSMAVRLGVGILNFALGDLLLPPFDRFYVSYVLVAVLLPTKAHSGRRCGWKATTEVLDSRLAGGAARARERRANSSVGGHQSPCLAFQNGGVLPPVCPVCLSVSKLN
jgi:hypothetical protein